MKKSGLFVMSAKGAVAAAMGVLLLLSVAALAQSAEWDIDPNHSTAQFTVRHMGLSNVSGSFTKVSGKAMIDDGDITKSQVEATIDVNSVDTRVDARDKDLRSPNFFDVAKYPTMEFKSSKIMKNGDKLQLVGDLTIHGTTRSVTLDVDGPTAPTTDPYGNQRRGLSASTSINRQDYGLRWNNRMGTGEAIVGDTVKIQIDAELIKKK
jgi:polyisoprenoid-binding protein YceI